MANMGVVWRANGFVFTIFTRDHGPPHVHVRKGDADAKVYLEHVGVADFEGFRAPQLRQILEIVKQKQDHMLGEWERIHGKA